MPIKLRKTPRYRTDLRRLTLEEATNRITNVLTRISPDDHARVIDKSEEYHRNLYSGIRPIPAVKME